MWTCGCIFFWHQWYFYDYYILNKGYIELVDQIHIWKKKYETIDNGQPFIIQTHKINATIVQRHIHINNKQQQLQ
jgi:hypothetical protein